MGSPGEHFGEVTKSLTVRSARAQRSAPRERSPTCLSAFHWRRVGRESVSGVWGRSPQIKIGGAARN